MDQGVTGSDSARLNPLNPKARQIGVGKLHGNHPAILSVTGMHDFSRQHASGHNLTTIGSDVPVILVVKKNKSILENLIDWLKGRKILTPALVIDDEGDNASIDTSRKPSERELFGLSAEERRAAIEDAEQTDPTVINGLIRRLLMCFDRRAFVAYTATPFANVFIDPDARSEEFGPDLFPSAFIINLPTPNTHIGPKEVFGIDADERAGTTEDSGLPLVEIVGPADQALISPPGRGAAAMPTGMPDSLRKAIAWFILSCAIRAVRGQGAQHHSMLIHVTRYKVCQAKVRDMVKQYLEDIRGTMLLEGSAKDRLTASFHQMYQDEHLPAREGILRLRPDATMGETRWEDVVAAIPREIARLVVHMVNGDEKDTLQYRQTPDGLHVIAVGGDKLSRGLTLEGLSVSYFLRTSKMYDTLMQMGRWFGYRPGYLDCCRLFISEELQQNYRWVALVSAELRRDFDVMIEQGGTPRDFGLRVRQHPGMLEITAATKMQTARDMEVAFADSLLETVVFSNETPVIRHNMEVMGKLVLELGIPNARPRVRPACLMWKGVKPEIVLRFLKGYRNHPASFRSDGEVIADYIRAQNEQTELVEWSVLLVNSADKTEDAAMTATIAGQAIGLSLRSNASKDPRRYIVPRRHIISPDDEIADLTDAEMEDAWRRDAQIRATRRRTSAKEDGGRPNTPCGTAIRSARPLTRGLLILYPLIPGRTRTAGDPWHAGFAFSLPASPTARKVVYAANKVLQFQNATDLDPITEA